MSKEELQGKLQDWIANTGLPLELQAKSEFLKAGFAVSHSSLYVDPQEGKGREIDVVAYYRDHFGLIQTYVVIECKATANPWVVLTDEREYGHVINSSLGVMSDNVLDALPSGWNLGRSPVGDVLGRMHRSGYSLKQAFSKQNDAAFEAAISVLKAALAVVSEQEGKTKRYKVALPVIVVDAPIFECMMGADGAIALREISYSEVRFTAYIPTYTAASIRIVNKAELPYFARTCVNLARSIRAELGYKVEEWIEQTRAKGGPTPGAE